jgi:cyanophycinase-like exopeptidase
VNLTLDLATPVATLVLIGGGEFSFGETREVDEALLSRLPAGNRAVAFLPTASGSSEYATHFGNYLRGIDPTVSVTNVPVYRGRDNRRQKNLDAIMGAGLIYLGGGVTNNLLDTLRESPAELALRDAASNGAIVAAIGGAAAAFGAWCRDMRGTAPTVAGLGWLRATAVDSPFDPANDVTLRRLMSHPDVMLGLGIPAGTALIVRGDGSTEIAGSGSVAAFRRK